MCGIHLVAWKDPSCSFCQSVFQHLQSRNTNNVVKDLNDGSPNDGPTSSHSVVSICNDVSEYDDGNLRRRGPDALGVVGSTTFPNSNFHLLQLSASVLRMRKDLHPQPVQIDISAWLDGDGEESEAEARPEKDPTSTAYLCWNGEVYQQLPLSSLDNNDSTIEDVWMYETSDTQLVSNLLQQKPPPFRSTDDIPTNDQHDGRPHNDRSSSPTTPLHQHHIASVMSRLFNAEFAFLILTSKGVYFGRDRWGRRSLLRWSCPAGCGSFQIVSVAEERDNTFVSVGTVDDATPPTSSSSSSPLMEWIEVPPGQVHTILFSDNSGGGEGTSSTTPTSLDYPNVIFESPIPNIDDVPYDDQQRKDRWNVVGTDIRITPPPVTTVSDRLWRSSLEFEWHLRRAVAMRLDQSSSVSERIPSSTGVLFSGGVDSVVLAALSADILSSSSSSSRSTRLTETSTLPPLPRPILHLSTVSFGLQPERSADRRAAIVSYQSIQERYGDRIDIVFHDVIAGWDEICQVEPHIRTLLLPKATVMDVNIATALWFASRGDGATGSINDSIRSVGTMKMGNGTIVDGDDGAKMTGDDSSLQPRPPRVLLVGMGADEQMGGYGRHRKAFERGGIESFRKELLMDQDRLWERNLGRDDRLCSDHGREARFPFLDAHVVEFLKYGVPLEDVCNFGLPPGQGDKQILRLTAQRLGLDHASGLVKRAIQFGSRISHLSDTKRFGSRRKAKGEASI